VSALPGSIMLCRWDRVCEPHHSVMWQRSVGLQIFPDLARAFSLISRFRVRRITDCSRRVEAYFDSALIQPVILLTPLRENRRRIGMKWQSEQPFDSIESTYDFFRILSDAVAEAKCELEGQIQIESKSKSSRRLDALRVAAYSLQKLELHISHSRRILNDLRSLRRLLFEERAASKAAIASKPVALPAPEIPAASLHVVTAQVARVRGKNGGVVAA